jgi:hypothetical protein
VNIIEQLLLTPVTTFISAVVWTKLFHRRNLKKLAAEREKIFGDLPEGPWVTDEGVWFQPGDVIDGALIVCAYDFWKDNRAACPIVGVMWKEHFFDDIRVAQQYTSDPTKVGASLVWSTFTLPSGVPILSAIAVRRLKP